MGGGDGSAEAVALVELSAQRRLCSLLAEKTNSYGSRPDLPCYPRSPLLLSLVTETGAGASRPHPHSIYGLGLLTGVQVIYHLWLSFNFL